MHKDPVIGGREIRGAHRAPGMKKEEDGTQGAYGGMHGAPGMCNELF